MSKWSFLFLGEAQGSFSHHHGGALAQATHGALCTTHYKLGLEGALLLLWMPETETTAKKLGNIFKSQPSVWKMYVDNSDRRERRGFGWCKAWDLQRGKADIQCHALQEGAASHWSLAEGPRRCGFNSHMVFVTTPIGRFHKVCEWMRTQKS